MDEEEAPTISELQRLVCLQVATTTSGVEALQTYEQWSEDYMVKLRQVEYYWEACVELMAALKEGAIASFILTVKEEEMEATSISRLLFLLPLRLFIAHLEVEYGGFRRDEMQCIKDFYREKEDTPRTMYT